MLILSDSGVLTATTQLFLLNSIARRQRTAPSWAAAGERLFTTRASISVSYALLARLRPRWYHLRPSRLHRIYYGPVRHPLAFDRLPGLAGYTIYLTPMISHRDERGFTSYSACPCHRAVAYTPPRWDTASVRFRHPMLPSPCSGGLGPRILLFRGHICVYRRYGPVTRNLP